MTGLKKTYQRDIVKTLIGVAIGALVSLATVSIRDHYTVSTLVRANAERTIQIEGLTGELKSHYVRNESFEHVVEDIGEIKQDVKDIKNYMRDNQL